MTYKMLLERVGYISRPERQVLNLAGEEHPVRDTFPYNPQSKTSPETARRWALVHVYDPTTREWNAIGANQPVPEEHPNEPFRVTILSLEVRDEGGRAYKVVDDEGRQFDLREDQLVEALRHAGIERGGRIGGEFVWGVFGSQVKMVFVGGQLHSDMVQELARSKEMNVISLKDLTVGKTYVKRNGEMCVYVGELTHPKLSGVHRAFVYYRDHADEHGDIIDVDASTNPITYTYAEAGTDNLKLSLQRFNCMSDRCVGEYWYHAFDIEVMKSPKLYGEREGTSDVSELRSLLKTSSHIRLVNGHGESLSELDYEKTHGQRLQFGHDVRKTYGHSHTAALRAAVAATRLQFNQAIVWR